MVREKFVWGKSSCTRSRCRNMALCQVHDEQCHSLQDRATRLEIYMEVDI